MSAPHYFDKDTADADDFMLGMAKAQGYVPQTCLLGGIVVMAEIQDGRNPCWGCDGPREKCHGKEKAVTGTDRRTEMSLYSCDNCYAPMIGHTHHRAEVCPLGDTDQCLLCSWCEDFDTIEEEIDALLEHQKIDATEAIAEQMSKLSERLNILGARAQRRLDEQNFPREVAADRRRGL